MPKSVDDLTKYEKDPRFAALLQQGGVNKHMAKALLRIIDDADREALVLRFNPSDGHLDEPLRKAIAGNGRTVEHKVQRIYTVLVDDARQFQDG